MNPVALQILIIGAVIAVTSAVVNKKVVNQKRMKEIRAKVTDFQKRLNEAKKKNDKELISRLEKEQEEVMKLTTEMMMSSFKPMMYTFVPILAIFYLLNIAYNGTGNVVDVPVVGLLNWFWWYVLVVFAVGMCFEAIYKVLTREKK
jgi:uncharacterized membrane protein (DUF106 family)